MEDEQLIQCVQRYSVLYDKTDPKYSNRDLTYKAWAEVSSDLNETVDVVKKRWTYLRDYFRKQQKLVDSGKTDESKKKKWALYDSLTFLLPYMDFGNTSLDAVSETFQSLDSSDEVSEESVPVAFGSQPQENAKWQQSSMVLSQHPRRKRTLNDVDHQFVNTTKKHHCEEEDDHEHFVKSLLPMMRSLDSLAAMEFRHEVQGILIKYIKRAQEKDAPSQSEIICHGATVGPSFQGHLT